LGRKIKQFSDGSFLEYDKGSIDDWCVYLTNSADVRVAPRDVDYFATLKSLASQFGAKKVYEDYTKVYDWTKATVDDQTLGDISLLAASYGTSALLVDTVFSILYLAMIAEENKKNTRLGKRIKRLGIYKLIIEDKSAYEAANFMRGMKWKEIDELCKKCGF